MAQAAETHKVIRHDVARLKLDGGLQQLRAFFPAPFEAGSDGAQLRPGLRQTLVQPKRFERRQLGFGVPPRARSRPRNSGACKHRRARRSQAHNPGKATTARLNWFSAALRFLPATSGASNSGPSDRACRLPDCPRFERRRKGPATGARVALSAAAMARAISSWTAKTSASSRSNMPDQSSTPLTASIALAETRRRLSAFRTLPSITVPAPSFSPICRTSMPFPLK